MNEKYLPFISIIFVITIIAIIGFWTESNIDFWLDYSGSEKDCPYWLAFIVSILAPFAIVVNILSEVAKLFV